MPRKTATERATTGPSTPLRAGLTVTPSRALPGARVAVTGIHLPLPPEGLPHVLVGTSDARVVSASSETVRFIVPAGTPGGRLPVRIDECISEPGWLDVARPLATDLHMVDSPVFDRDGRLYVTHSGSRDSKSSVPLYRLGRDGTKEALAVEIANPTSLALGPDGLVYISSRFDGHVYRLLPGDRVDLSTGLPTKASAAGGALAKVERYATDLGVATGLAFAPDGDLFVGDRSGTIFRVRPDRQVETFATLPSSVAAFHLAYGPDNCLYVTAPTLATHDALYRITTDRLVDTVTESFGRPQGLAFDATGMLYVVEALAGAAGLFRVDVKSSAPIPELVVSAPELVGVAFDPDGGAVLSSNDAVWKLDGMVFD